MTSPFAVEDSGSPSTSPLYAFAMLYSERGGEVSRLHRLPLLVQAVGPMPLGSTRSRYCSRTPGSPGARTVYML